jgi:DNA invertase Pin-like site-specific DNA recombinase
MFINRVSPKTERFTDFMATRLRTSTSHEIDGPTTHLIIPVHVHVTTHPCWTRPCNEQENLRKNHDDHDKAHQIRARLHSRQDGDRQLGDLRKAGVRTDDLYIDHDVSGAKASRPSWDRALAALMPEDTLVVTTLDQTGRSTIDLLTIAADLQERDVNLRVLNLGGENVNTATPTGRLLFTMMAGLAEMQLEVERERNRDSVSKRRVQGKNLDGRPRTYTDAKLRLARKALKDPCDKRTAAEIASTLGMSRSTMLRRIKGYKQSESKSATPRSD